MVKAPEEGTNAARPTGAAWQREVHAAEFDGWATLSLGELKKTYESFNEIMLFLENKPSLEGGAFVEVGCATGELYRYLKRYHPEFQYFGFDISEPAIHRARGKYPEGTFTLCSDGLAEITRQCPSSSVVFARDVVHHQPEPWDMLATLVRMPTQAAILRVRTRDKGETVLDPELSCQWVYGQWVPYIVMNIDKVVDVVCQAAPVSQLFIYKHYQQLGGHNGRFLPKECYYPETGTAETALFARLSPNPVDHPQIVVKERVDSNPRLGLASRGLRKMKRLAQGQRSARRQ